MKIRNLFFCLFLPLLAAASLKVGIGQADITPPVGTPSAGYADRKGEGMVGTHDPLLALALIIDNGEKQIALCSVDHLGFTYEMVQAVMERVHQRLPHCEIYIASSHSHSGGGAYLNIPVLGESLAGPYNKEIANFYIEQTVAAIIGASQNQIPAKVGIGYGKTGHLSQYRSNWPLSISPLQDVAVIKVRRTRIIADGLCCLTPDDPKISFHAAHDEVVLSASIPVSSSMCCCWSSAAWLCPPNRGQDVSRCRVHSVRAACW